MKTPFCFPLFAAAVLWLPALSLAQTITSGLPGFISYQGRVLNSTGGLVGSGTPVNRTVTFRIWDHPSNTQAANLIYSETQTVTIADGEFSVLVGQGVATTATPFSYSETTKGPSKVPPVFSIADAFNGSERFLAVTVDDGTAAVDNEITPRQQIVSSAFAFRSKFAETLGTSGGTAMTVVDSGNIGVGNATPPARFTITGANTTSASSTPQLLITDSADSSKRLRIGVDSSGTGTGFIQSFKEGTGVQNLLLNPNGGFVGIGRTNPATALDVNGVIRAYNGSTGAPSNGENGGPGQRLVFWPGDPTTTPYGMGMDGSTLWQAVPTGSVHKWYEGTAEMMRLAKGGLGIGTVTPVGRLNLSEATGSVAGINNGTLVLDHENNGGASSIVFRSRVNRGSDFGFIQYQDTATVGGAGESAVLTLGISNDGDDHIALMPSGNAGVGTTSPRHKLHVTGGVASRGNTASDGYVALSSGNSGQSGYIEFFRPGSPASVSSDFRYRMAYMGWDPNNLSLVTENGTNFTIPNGIVGIGINNPTYGRLTVMGGQNITGIRGGYVNGGGVGNAVTHGTHPISIYAEHTIWAGNSVIASSDERIKNIEGVSNSATDLKTLLDIKITDYHYKDTLGKSDVPQKKVIAQQLEKVFPQAVAKMTDAVPDIYKRATFKDGWIQLATDLKKGERVKLITETKTEVHEVLEARKDMFRTDFDPKAQAAAGEKEFDGNLFVYGREVNDFRTVDYDAISMLNVSATQELKREMDVKVKALTEENALLRTRLTAFEAREAARTARLEELEASDKARQTRMAAIEKLLQSSGTTTAVPVSLKEAK